MKVSQASVKMVAPSIYRFEGCLWGWYKMTDLVKAYNDVLADYPYDPVDAVGIGKQFADMNKRPTFWWFCFISGDHIHVEREVRDTPPDEVPWGNEHLFVPAQWGLDILDSITRVMKKASKRKLNGIEE
jgi:hypothetical protein